MTEAHFRYEGSVYLKNINNKKESEIQSVVFLTPAKINFKDFSLLVSIDIINRKVYDQDGKEVYSKEVFDYLDAVNTLPEDFFAAPPEVLEKANEFERERMKAQNFDEILGDISG